MTRALATLLFLLTALPAQASYSLERPKTRVRGVSTNSAKPRCFVWLQEAETRRLLGVLAYDCASGKPENLYAYAAWDPVNRSDPFGLGPPDVQPPTNPRPPPPPAPRGPDVQQPRHDPRIWKEAKPPKGPGPRGPGLGGPLVLLQFGMLANDAFHAWMEGGAQIPTLGFDERAAGPQDMVDPSNYRPGAPMTDPPSGGTPEVPFELGGTRPKTPVPDLDESGKVHTPDIGLPDLVPEDWTREDMEDARDALEKSIAQRKEENLQKDRARNERIERGEPPGEDKLPTHSEQHRLQDRHRDSRPYARVRALRIPLPRERRRDDRQGREGRSQSSDHRQGS